MDPVRGIMKNGMKVAPIVLSVCKSPLKIATRQWARMTKIDVLFSGREKPLLLMYEQIVHTRQGKQKHIFHPSLLVPMVSKARQKCPFSPEEVI